MITDISLDSVLLPATCSAAAARKLRQSGQPRWDGLTGLLEELDEIVRNRPTT